MMRKVLSLLLVLIVALALVPGAVVAQDDGGDDEVNVLEEIVYPRLMEYNENLPEHYGTLSLEDFLVMLAEEEDFIILDVREADEIEELGTIEGAIHIPLRTLGDNLDLLPDLDATIVVICAGGYRATIGMTALHVLGYENAQVLVGGFGAWLAEELPVVDEPVEAEIAEVSEDIDPLLLDYVAEYLANLPEGWGAVKPDALFEEMFETPPDYILDVRSEEEWMDPGFIEDAQWLWVDNFMMSEEEWPAELDANIVVYCASSYRGGVVMTMMGLLGYENVRNLAGGIKGWVAADLPLVVPEAES